MGMGLITRLLSLGIKVAPVDSLLRIWLRVRLSKNSAICTVVTVILPLLSTGQNV